MSNRLLQRFVHATEAEDADADDAGRALAGGTGGSRAEAVQRLQIGISGLVLMILLMTLAGVIRDRADQADADAVPEAAAAVEPSPTLSATTQSDPLSEAGVVPDLPAGPSPKPSPKPSEAAPAASGAAAPGNAKK